MRETNLARGARLKTKFVPRENTKMFRKNVSAVLYRVNELTQAREFLLCRRKDGFGWQSVQGGVEDSDASFEAAIMRECKEELGESKECIEIERRSRFWRRYLFLPNRPKKQNEKDKYDGQDQLFFLLKVLPFANIQRGILGKVVEDEFDKIEWVPLATYVEKFSSFKRCNVVDFLHEVSFLDALSASEGLSLSRK
jgi:8-oxo-dGTP pyrophosphatase MutT (NUDIX family)